MNYPPVGKVRVMPDGSALVTLSTKRRMQAPGIIIARSRGAEALNIAFEHSRAHIEAQATNGDWMCWRVSLLVTAAPLPIIEMIEIDGVFQAVS